MPHAASIQSSPVTSSPIVSSFVRKLENEGWDRSDENMSLEISIMLSANDGISFIILLDDWLTLECEVNFLEFNMNQKIKEYPPFRTTLDQLDKFTKPYLDRAFDWKADLEALDSQVEAAEIEDITEQLKAS